MKIFREAKCARYSQLRLHCVSAAAAGQWLPKAQWASRSAKHSRRVMLGALHWLAMNSVSSGLIENSRDVQYNTAARLCLASSLASSSLLCLPHCALARSRQSISASSPTLVSPRRRAPRPDSSPSPNRPATTVVVDSSRLFPHSKGELTFSAGLSLVFIVIAITQTRKRHALRSQTASVGLRCIAFMCYWRIAVCLRLP